MFRFLKDSCSGAFAWTSDTMRLRIAAKKIFCRLILIKIRFHQRTGLFSIRRGSKQFFRLIL